MMELKRHYYPFDPSDTTSEGKLRAVIPTLRRGLFILLFWLLLTSVILILFAYETSPFSFLGLNKLALFVEESKLFFISIILPLVLSRITQPKPSGWAGSIGTIVFFITFILLSLPLTLATSYFGGIGFNILLRSNLLLLLIVLFLISLYSRMQSPRGNPVPAADPPLAGKSLPTTFSRYISFYYLIFFLLFGIMPVLYYLILEFTKQSCLFLIAINPFWLFWQIKQADTFYSTWLLQCLIWIGMIILVVLIRIIALRSNKKKSP